MRVRVSLGVPMNDFTEKEKMDRYASAGYFPTNVVCSACKEPSRIMAKILEDGKLQVGTVMLCQKEHKYRIASLTK